MKKMNEVLWAPFMVQKQVDKANIKKIAKKKYT